MNKAALMAGAAAAVGAGFFLGRRRQGKSDPDKANKRCWPQKYSTEDAGSKIDVPYRDETNLAGNGEAGFVDGDGAAARFDLPTGIAIDGDGNIIVSDFSNHAIRKVTPGGNVATLAGNGEAGFVDGDGAAARFNLPNGIAIDGDGNIIVSDSINHAIRKVTPGGNVATLAGNGETGFVDGDGAAARFKVPIGIAIDGDGNIIVSDSSNHAIRKVTPGGNVATLAGNGEAGFVDGDDAAARFNVPIGIAIDGDGNIIVSDSSNHAIRKVTPGGKVTTLAGNGEAGFVDGDGAAARFNLPYGMAIDGDGNIIVSDSSNNAIRKVTLGGNVCTYCVLGFACYSMAFDAVGCLTASSGNRVFKVLARQTPPKSRIQFNLDMRKMMNCRDLYDVTFVAGEEQEEIKAHRLILINRSDYFRTMLNSNFREGKPDTKIELLHVKPSVLRALLAYLYTASLQVDDDDVLDVAQKASEYQLSELLNECIGYCQDNLAAVNAVAWLMKSDRYSLDALRQMLLRYVCQNLSDIKVKAPDTLELLSGPVCREVIMSL